MIDLKHLNRHKHDKLLDDLVTGAAWFLARILLMFYSLGAMPT